MSFYDISGHYHLKTNYNFYYDRNRALQTHMLYFCSIADTAIANEWRVSYVVFRKRIKTDEIARGTPYSVMVEQTKQRYGFVMSYSYYYRHETGGYMYIYYISTAENELYVGDSATAFIRFMKRKTTIY